jgi:hypothetical protein
MEPGPEALMEPAPAMETAPVETATPMETATPATAAPRSIHRGDGNQHGTREDDNARQQSPHDGSSPCQSGESIGGERDRRLHEKPPQRAMPRSSLIVSLDDWCRGTVSGQEVRE